ncbi:NAD-dependent epimerase/dehydratase family protein [Calycomorphotria hydatis]|uniref:dTDP-4-oxo-6-deoxy-D-allose reductase n=1 Tax=Calycomorphotria hydatis TaxID=2528027 RepID=A0A517T7C5_9PLAN|nr:NAD-dependent epimerase/dehydratase family protein [Calycomorphotria hydatis]QDT64272.1 dTDP-4-oxo-6-deoxy-D-allose reductase [Calycomorphotria hydatis]
MVVTGGGGFIGGHLCRRLVADGYEVLAVVRRRNGSSLAGVSEHVADLSSPGSLLPADWDGASFVLIHLAWDIASRGDFAAQAECLSDFAGLVGHWTGRGLCGVVSFGTSEEYGAKSGVLAEADGAEGALSAYGWAKASSRNLLESWSVHAGVAAVWLRPFTVYGPGQSGQMLIPYAIQQALDGQVASFTAGTQKRDFVYVDDVVAATAAALGRVVREGGDGGLWEFNLGTGDAVAVCDAIKMLGERLGCRHLFRIGAKPSPKSGAPVQVAGIAQASDLLGWSPKINLADGLDRIVSELNKDKKWAA